MQSHFPERFQVVLHSSTAKMAAVRNQRRKTEGLKNLLFFFLLLTPQANMMIAFRMFIAKKTNERTFCISSCTAFHPITVLSSNCELLFDAFDPQQNMSRQTTSVHSLHSLNSPHSLLISVHCSAPRPQTQTQHDNKCQHQVYSSFATHSTSANASVRAC